MSVQERRVRDRQKRERRIVRTAREIAEAEGWDAVTTRRLSQEIEYSQPVLYGHFPDGRAGIVRAVALQGFEELLAAVRPASDDGADAEGEKIGEEAPREVGPAAKDDPAARLIRVVEGYLGFAREHPASYEAMFSMSIGVPFADDATPDTLQKCFAAIQEPLVAATGPDDGTRTELLWATLHGLATLARDHRIREESTRARTAALLASLLAPATPPPPPLPLR